MKLLRIINDDRVAFINYSKHGAYLLIIKYDPHGSMTTYGFKAHMVYAKHYKYKQSAVRYALNHL